MLEESSKAFLFADRVEYSIFCTCLRNRLKRGLLQIVLRNLPYGRQVSGSDLCQYADNAL